MTVDDIINTGVFYYLIDKACNHKSLSREEKAKMKEKAIKKRAMCVSHYLESDGYHWAIFRYEDPDTGKVTEWKEIIREDPYGLYKF